MTERSNYQVGGVIVPVIPYDTFEAANLFLATGRSSDEVLPLIGLDAAEWNRLRETYRWFPYASGDNQRRDYFTGLDEAEIYRLVLPPRWRVKEGDEPSLGSTWHIREAVRRNPYIGPFADRGWPYTFIAVHAEATLCCYTHDGHTVYFNGKPLTDRRGEPIEVDATSFKAVGGRWLYDKHHVYGEGQYGANRTSYWYIVEEADAATFEALNLRYARDRNQAYYITGKTIRTKSPDAFEIVPDVRLNYRDDTRDLLHDISVIARDREAVYFYGARLKGARPESFQVLGHDYATDGKTVWYLDQKKVVEGADPETFTVPGPGEPSVWGRPSGTGVTDRYRPYVHGKPCDPQECMEDWRPFFEARSDLKDWWWHKLTQKEC
jgi:hypothetical protein